MPKTDLTSLTEDEAATVDELLAAFSSVCESIATARSLHNDELEQFIHGTRVLDEVDMVLAAATALQKAREVRADEAATHARGAMLAGMPTRDEQANAKQVIQDLGSKGIALGGVTRPQVEAVLARIWPSLLDEGDPAVVSVALIRALSVFAELAHIPERELLLELGRMRLEAKLAFDEKQRRVL
jgi:hypothetical protein